MHVCDRQAIVANDICVTHVWLKMCMCAERSLAIFLARSPFKSNPPLASTREIDAKEAGRDSQIDWEKEEERQRERERKRKRDEILAK